MAKEYIRMRFVLVVALLGCSSTRNPQKCLEGLCPDPALPFCDVDGSLNGEPNTCIAVSCTPNAFEECRGDRALTCNATGDNYELVQCEFGCGPDGCIACDSPECEKRIVPNYVSKPCADLADKESLVIDADTGFDTGQGDCDMTIVQTMGPEICVIHRRRITIAPNATLKVRGTRALALVADYAFALEGTLDVSADATVNGPGVSNTIVSGSTAAGMAGGGAGYRTAGGSGGDQTTVGGAMNGGPAGQSPKLIGQLLAGRQTARAANTQLPGGAGGAATIVSCRAKVSVTGVINAGGGGGAASRPNTAGTGVLSSTGGGSGGTIVIQGMQVVVTGQLFANGGGGGGGGGSCSLSSGTCPMPGSDGLASTMAAPGGIPPSDMTGTGGNGGASSPPADGGVGPVAGGGGGSSGYILVYTPEGAIPQLFPTAVSPALEEPGAVATN